MELVELPSGQVDPRFEPYRSMVLVAPDHIQSGTGILLAKETAAEQRAISGKYLFGPGDIIYSKIRPYLRKAILADFEGLSSADMYPLSPQDGVESRYLLAVILGEHFSRFAEIVSMRSGFPKINREELAEYSAALPPVAEQRRIAEILDTVDEAIRQTEQLIAKLKQMKQGLLHDLLTRGIDENGELRDPDRHPEHFQDSPLGRIPREWDVVRLGDLADVAGGVTLGRALSGSGTVELPYLRVANVQDGYLDLSEIKTVRILTTEESRYRLEDGDVLMNEGGDYDKLGRGTVWEGQILRCLHQNHVFRVRCDQRRLRPWFLASISESFIGKSYFLRASKQTTNLATINSTQIKAFRLPLPSFEEQDAIIDILDASRSQLAAEDQELTKLRLLKQGLMEDLLTGRVRVTELENASETPPRGD